MTKELIQEAVDKARVQVGAAFLTGDELPKQEFSVKEFGQPDKVSVVLEPAMVSGDDVPGYAILVTGESFGRGAVRRELKDALTNGTISSAGTAVYGLVQPTGDVVIYLNSRGTPVKPVASRNPRVTLS